MTVSIIDPDKLFRPDTVIADARFVDDSFLDVVHAKNI